MVRRLFLHGVLGVHAVAAAVYWGLQPRGFAWGSPSFFEHQGIVPLYFAASLIAAALPLRFGKTWVAAAGVPVGYWMSVSAATAAVATPFFKVVFSILFAGSAAAVGLLVLFGRSRRISSRIPLSGTTSGLLLGASFVVCTWAPPASTRPLDRMPAEPPASTEPLKIALQDPWIVIGQGDSQLRVDPQFHFDSASESGHWTIFNYQYHHLPGWTVVRQDETRWELAAERPPIKTRVQIWSESGQIHVRASTTLEQSVAAHLSRCMTIAGPGPAFMEEVPWPPGTDHDVARFIAFRGDRLEFLKAAGDEKGPFEILAGGPPRDPVLRSGPWRIQVLGWEQQASRKESPTAGWGVSQGAIERWDGTFMWSLAATSIGRGWHAVRTGPGTYCLEVIIGRQP